MPETDQIVKPSTPTASASDSNNYVSILEQLAKLHERGILTDEEFQKKEADILEKM